MIAYNLETALRHPNEVRELYIHNRGLTDFPLQILSFPQLRKLELSNNRLSQLPPDLIRLTQLEALLLPNNRFETLPDWLFQLTQLRHIDFSNNQLNSLPSSLFECRQLQSLRFAHNKIQSLPDTLGQLSELQRLSLPNNQLQQLPSSIGQLRQLKVVELTSNQITHLPQEIGECQSLHELQLSENRLKALPNSLGQLQQLMRLRAKNNRISQLPESIAHCEGLTELDLSNNQLQSLPPEIGHWRHLLDLNLSRNQLSHLPPSITQNVMLRKIDCSRNKLATLPNWASLPRLRELNLERNQLTQWPEGLNQLKILEVLLLAKNPLPIIDTELLDLDRLKKLSSPDKVAVRKQLLRFRRACKKVKEMDEAQRLALYRLLTEKNSKAKAAPLPLLLLALDVSFPALNDIIRQQIRQYYSPPLASRPLAKGAAIAVLGRTRIGKQQLKKELEENGITYHTQLNEECTHLVLGKQPGIRQLPANSVLIYLEERELYAHLRKYQKKGYLTKAAPPAQLERLGQLLMSGQKVNIEMALQIMDGGGVPPTLLTELFIAYKHSSSSALRSRLRQLLELNGSPALATVLQLRTSLSPKLSKEQRMINIRKYTEETELEEEKLSIYLEKKSV